MNLIKILLLFIISTISYANTILIDKNKNYFDVLSKSEIYIDKTKSLTLDKLSEVKFKKNDKKTLSFGYSPNFDVWVKFTLKNSTNKKIKRILEYDNPISTNIVFFDLKSKIIKKEGSFESTKDRISLNPIFKIILKPNEKKTYYIKTTSKITTLIVKLKLWDLNKFINKELKRQTILGVFFGGMLVLALYNLCIYFTIKDVSYLFYVLYFMGIIFHNLVYIGFANLYFLSNSNMIFVTNNAVLLVSFPIISLALFTKYFLKIEQYKRIEKIFNIFFIITIINIVFFMVLNEFNNYRNLLPIIFFIYLLIISVYATIKKNKQAYFVLIGWTIIIIAAILMYLSSYGIYDVFKKFPYIVETAFTLEAIIFSVALADKIKQLQKEKDIINEKLIKQKKEERDKLKIQVEEKTIDLQKSLNEQELLLKELHHRVKNNMQMICSLIRLQADDINDEKISDIFITIQNRINAMSHLHELLYRQDNISKLDTYAYFDRLIDELKDSYSSENVDIILNIKVNVEIEEAIYCGFILNELVTNSIKYAFKKNKKGKIIISLEKQNGFNHLVIRDNGIGYESNRVKNSLGQLLVETLAKNQLKGTLIINSENGVKVEIKWKNND